MKKGEDSSGENNYTVGFKRPPEHSRFQKGQSGNKKGRPKESKNLKTETMEELTETIKVRIGDRQVRVSKFRALLKILTLKAMKGDMRSLNALLNLMVQIFSLEGLPPETEIRLTPEERAVLDLFEKRLTEADHVANGGEEDSGKVPNS